MSRFEEFFFIAFITVWLAVLALINIVRGNTVTLDIAAEAGTEVPGPEAFFTSPAISGTFVTDISSIDTSATGVKRLEILVGEKIYEVSLNIIDTTPPGARAAERYVFAGNDLLACDLVADITDATEVVCSFSTPADTETPGWHNAAVMLTDGGGNVSVVYSKYYVFELIDELVIEAGANAKNFSEQDFILNHTDAPGLSIDIPFAESNFSRTGEFRAAISSDGYTGYSAVKIIDTVPPRALPNEIFCFTGNNIKACDLVTDILDATEVVCSFASPPDTSVPGRHKAVVILTDGGGNTATVESGYFVFDYAEELVVEAGDPDKIFTGGDFLRNYIDTDRLFIEFPGKSTDISLAGEYRVALKCDGYTAPSVLRVVDTTPPAAKVRDTHAYLNKPIPASNFVYDVTDASEVSVSYESVPDFSVMGKQAVMIILEDEYKNRTEYAATLDVVTDTEPPRISGALDKEAALGGTISYRTGIVVTDDYDPNPSLTVDSSGVDLRRPGEYTVIYAATDESGNRSERAGTVAVREIGVEYVNEMADDILSQITDDTMTEREKAYEIFMWVTKKMKYAAGNSTRSLALGAYACFSKGVGDCYVFMSGSRMLLMRAGIQTAEVHRIGGYDEHYWLLVNTGDGWYHFDACHNASVSAAERFMFGEAKAREYTKRIGDNRAYFEYDRTTVPKVEE